MLIIVLAILLGDAFQRLMSISCQAGYTFEVPICSQMSNLGTFLLVSMLLLIASWGIFSSILPRFGKSELARKRELRIIIFLSLLILLIGIAIVGNYFVQRIDRMFF